MVEAKDLMKKDIGVLGKGKSDPYAIVHVGSQQFKTQTIDNTVNPKWDYWCEVITMFIDKVLSVSIVPQNVFELRAIGVMITMLLWVCSKSTQQFHYSRQQVDELICLMQFLQFDNFTWISNVILLYSFFW